MKILALIFTLAMICLGIIAFTAPANAQSYGMCGQFESVLKQWASRYKEIPVAGDVKGPIKFILFISPQATWTVFYVRPDGLACMGPQGNNWETFKPEIPGEKS